MEKLKFKIVNLLRWSEKYTKTDMVYLSKNSFWINLNTIIVTIFSFLLYLLFANFVPKDVYGSYQFLISISSIIGSLTLTGMNVAVGQAVSRGFEGVFEKSIKTQLKFGVIPAIVGLVYGTYYLIKGNEIFAIAVVVIGVLIPITNSLNTWGAYMTGKKLFKSIFFYTQIINILYFGAIIFSIIYTPSVLPLLLFNIIFNFIANVVVLFLVLKKYPPNKKIDETSDKYGKKLSLSNILPMVVYHIDNIIVFHLLGAKELAIYSFASNIPDRFISLLRPIPTIAFPKFSEKSSDEISVIMSSKLLKFFLVSIFAGIIYFLISPWVFNVFFPQYQDSLNYSRVYVLVSIIAMVASFATTALFASRSSKIFITNTINPLFSILAIIIGGYVFGIWGVIFARLISNSFNLMVSTYFVNQAKNVKID